MQIWLHQTTLRDSWMSFFKDWNFWVKILEARAFHIAFVISSINTAKFSYLYNITKVYLCKILQFRNLNILLTILITPYYLQRDCIHTYFDLSGSLTKSIFILVGQKELKTLNKKALFYPYLFKIMESPFQ